MHDPGGLYARLCAWATRIGCSDEHVVDFARRVCQGGFLNDRERWPKLLVLFFRDEKARTGEPITLNAENIEFQTVMKRGSVNTTEEFLALYHSTLKIDGERARNSG